MSFGKWQYNATQEHCTTITYFVLVSNECGEGGLDVGFEGGEDAVGRRRGRSAEREIN